MAKRKVAAKVVNFRPRANELEGTIRALATKVVSPGFSEHALVRMDERGITTLDVMHVLKVGSIKGEIEAGRAAGEWKCKVVANIRGNRDAGVVTVVINREKLFVKTVEWEDL